MKQILVGLSIIILVSIILSFTGSVNFIQPPMLGSNDTIDQKKEYPVKMVVANWDKFYQGLSITASELRQSDRPSKNVSFIIDSVIVPLQQQIAMQLQKQIADDPKKPK